jgi:hypothetical protein
MAMFDDTSVLAACMEKQLALKECRLEGGSTVTNLEGICQAFIGWAVICKRRISSPGSQGRSSFRTIKRGRPA